jgi:hypothetical protein
MKRRLLNLLTALSLLLSIAVAALWAWSYRRCATIGCASTASVPTLLWSIHTWPGHVDVWHSRRWRTPPPPPDPPHWFVVTFPTPVHNTDMSAEQWHVALLGVVLAGHDRVKSGTTGAGPYTLRDSFHTLILPYWVPWAATAALPSMHVARAFRRRRRQDARRCPSCGYDLRATPGRCPECGTPATTLA